METISGLLCIAVPVGIISALWAAFYVLLVVASYFRFLSRFVAWVSRDEVKLLPDALEAEHTLQTLGLELMGVEKFSMFMTQTPIYMLFHIDPNRIYLAALHPQRATEATSFYIIFITHFEDQSIVITRYPIGADIITPRFVSATSSHSVEQAYAEHTERVGKHIALEGTNAVHVKDLAHILTLDKLYDKLYKRRDNRDLYINLSLQALSLGVVSFACWVMAGVVYPVTGEGIFLWFVIALIAAALMLYLSVRGGLQPTADVKGKRKKRANLL